MDLGLCDLNCKILIYLFFNMKVYLTASLLGYIWCPELCFLVSGCREGRVSSALACLMYRADVLIV